MALVILDDIEPSKYRESLEASLEISSLSSPDLRKQIAIIRETLHPDGGPTSFGMIARLLVMAKATVAEHYTRYVAERPDVRGPVAVNNDSQGRSKR
jgi:hypothetical protein